MKHLYDERASVWAKMQALRKTADEEKRSLTAEERQTWDQQEARVSELSDDIERFEQAERHEARQKTERQEPANRSADDDEREKRERHESPPDADAEQRERAEKYDRAFGAYVRRGIGRLSQDEQSLLEAGFVQESRAAGEATGAAGGYTVPQGFLNKMTESMKTFGGLLDIVETITTATGQALPWPTNDDTGNVGAILAENTQVSEQDVTFGQTQLGAYMYTSKLVRVSLQLLQDGAFDLDTWLPGKLGERIGRAVAAHIATGTGSGQPQGIATAVGVGKTGAAGQVASIIYDDLVDLEHSIDSSYLTGARYAMSNTALAMVRKLKDSQNRPLWAPNMVAGAPSTVNGWPYTIDNGIPVPAANSKSVLFGNFKLGYTARIVQGGQVLRLTERFADYLQVGFLGFRRVDGIVNDSAALKSYKHPAS